MAYLHMPVQNGMGAPSLDFIGCYQGIYFAIETKVPGARLTERQKLTACQIFNAGGRVFVVREQADVDHMIHVMKNVPQTTKSILIDTLWEEPRTV